MPRDSLRIREEFPVVLMQKTKVSPSGKESIPLDDDEEQVDCEHDDTDAYLTEPDDEGLDGDINSSSYMLQLDRTKPPQFRIMLHNGLFSPVGIDRSIPSLRTSHFEPIVNVEGAFNVLELMLTIDMTAALTPALVCNSVTQTDHSWVF
ncbi:uncharacterized protein A4U43_C09F10960 [Asparagus officinalis]|uniref:Uncharacterized protein n=1 Tax=Asparagus officinalis TaxID=4686 RepID=A0A5P1EA43_ASPOF|nr:uncharacterized protein A4U43_C09F10960 [Asparagus officinalis]